MKKIGKLVFSLSGLRLDSLFQLLCIRKILRQELKLLSVITILPLTWWTSYFQESFGSVSPPPSTKTTPEFKILKVQI